MHKIEKNEIETHPLRWEANDSRAHQELITESHVVSIGRGELLSIPSSQSFHQLIPIQRVGVPHIHGRHDGGKSGIHSSFHLPKDALSQVPVSPRGTLKEYPLPCQLQTRHTPPRQPTFPQSPWAPLYLLNLKNDEQDSKNE